MKIGDFQDPKNRKAILGNWKSFGFPSSPKIFNFRVFCSLQTLKQKTSMLVVHKQEKTKISFA